MNRLLSNLASVVLLGLAVVGGGCSSFRHDAREARKSCGSPSGVEGLWEGRWQDASRVGHGGRLECVLTRQGENVYRLSTRSHWLKWFTSAIDLTVVVTPVGPGVYDIRGSQEVWPFGDMTFLGRVDSTNFSATYDAGGHGGSMDLHRGASCCAAPAGH